MRALRYHRYGSPSELRIEEMPEPLPVAGSAKVRVHAVGLNPLDWKILAGRVRYVPSFRSPPRGVGLDFAGEIVAVGSGAAERKVGERVLGSLNPLEREGACADFVVAPARRLLPLPPEIDDAHAAALPIAAGTALQALADEAGLVAGQRVLITGAAGGVGHFAVQVARSIGAHVTGVCSARNVDFVRSLGADEVIDYGARDFTRGGDRYDVIFDAASASSFAASRRVLAPSGCYISSAGSASAVLGTVAGAVLARFTSRQRAIPIRLRNGPAMWHRLIELVRKGVLRAHVERTVALEEVADAVRAMEGGHGRGKVVVRLR